MEEQQKMKSATRKRKLMTKRNMHHKTVLPLLLAAVCSKSHVRKALITKCLNKIFQSLPRIHLTPILALLPSFLQFNCAEIVCRSAEIIGAASLESFEMNEQIALDDETVKSLISLLRSSKKDIATAACNAVLDLSTTSVGRQRLLEFNAIENFFICLIQEYKFKSTCLEEDEYSILLLQGAIALVNSCTIEQLEHIPTDLSESLLVLLKELWGHAYRKRLNTSSSGCDQGNEFCVSNTRTNKLVECIFRLSINCGLHLESVDFELVLRNLFDLGEATFKPFLSDVWETSPMLIKNASRASSWEAGIFDPFLQYLGSTEALPSILPSMLRCITYCPAIASDELDILHVFEEKKNYLGSPVIYNQDIRVVKTQSGERELHYFPEHMDSTFSVGPHVLSSNEILKCGEAFKEGYSIALRGMEFRYQTVAVIADKLAALFGQPSAGVNMYLTPSNSQGLARHSDDHCVFVCQLIGVKRWTVFPRPDFQLPRLYESSYSLHDMKDGSDEAHGHQQIVLKEGDVLYIPRGFPHEAIAVLDDDADANNSTKLSLHLTLAIEIEPPFEWEGFMQVALYICDKKQRILHYETEDPVQWSLQMASVGLLHIAIKLIGNLDPVFRRACLVGATPLSSDTRDWLLTNQRSTFGYLSYKITSDSKFSDAVSHLEAALQKNEDPLEHVRWMKYLSVEGEEIEITKSMSILIQHRDIAEVAFTHVKSKFVDGVEFQDVEQHYKLLLDKYRKVRKQYTNGMLSLHSALLDEHDHSLS